MDSPVPLLSLLHFADTSFPTGGYAHSFGLERYCQAGIVRDADGVERFLRAQLEGAAGPCDATAAVGTARAIARGDVDGCHRIDETVDAMKPVREFREGSRQMGRQTLRVSSALTGDERLGAYLEAVNAATAPGHHAPAFGMAAGIFGWSAEARRCNIRFIAYNTRFLILPWVRVPHLASHLLGRMAAALSDDWQRMYRHPIYFAETFIDPGRFRGTCYRAANWQLLGLTTGRGKNDQTNKPNRPIKEILGLPLTPRFREYLSQL